MPKYFIYEGVPVACSTKSGKAHDKFMADNEHLDGCEVSEEEYAIANDVLRKEDRLRQRRAAYNNGDYIDALMKLFNSKRLAGEDLPDYLDDAVQHWLGVKRDIPLD